MDTFDHFVKGLGPHAKHYTPEQLKQLQGEVKKLADVLLATHLAKVRSRKNTDCVQPTLDPSDDDRTLESVLIERVDGPERRDAHGS